MTPALLPQTGEIWENLSILTQSVLYSNCLVLYIMRIISFFQYCYFWFYLNIWYIFNIKAKTFLQNHDFPAKTTWIVIKDCGKVDVVRTSGCCCWWQLTANVTSCSDTEPAVIHQHSWTVSNLLKFTRRRNWGVILVKKTIFNFFLRKCCDIGNS